MAVNAAISIRLNAHARDEIGAAILTGMIRFVQEVIGQSAKPPPIGSPVDTGHNRRSIGWAASPEDERQFGNITTVFRETQGPRGEIGGSAGEVQSTDGPAVLIATTSGYGGLLEVGTRFMRARPYLLPALKALIQKLFQFIQEEIRRL